VKTCSTFTLKGFSIRNAGGGSLRSRGLDIDDGRRPPATEGGGEVTDRNLQSYSYRRLGLIRAGHLDPTTAGSDDERSSQERPQDGLAHLGLCSPFTSARLCVALTWHVSMCEQGS
jgi:hypothetical protein